MNSKLRIVVAALLFAASIAYAQSPLRIGKITIEPLDVYSPIEAEHGSLYRLADRLHIETRRSVIREFLLFREGDAYQPERLEETERNLRALSFLKSASVTASAPHDGVVDVRVELGVVPPERGDEQEKQAHGGESEEDEHGGLPGDRRRDCTPAGRHGWAAAAQSPRQLRSRQVSPL